jgi:2-polyprenyl-3-methyl-5-hydroxy-6-metoxy-1,4-benzoquinol methylase
MRKNKHFVTFRTPQEEECEVLDKGLISSTEWSSEDSYKRIFQESWEVRYQYETEILSSIINDNECKKIIELGPGPGLLCNKIITIHPELEYHLVDIEAAKIANEKENLGGIFHVQDLTNDLDTSNLPKDIDLVIANDFLEHIQNPANIILKLKSLLKPDGLAFISVPNWRMGHAWIYRGLFDWDNFIHFMWQHGFAFEGCIESPLKVGSNSRISSESTTPENMLDSWNWYMLFKRNDNE